MPDDNKQPQQQAQPQVDDVLPPIITVENELPPITANDQPAIEQQNLNNTGSAAPIDDATMPPIISTPKKKFAGGKIIATILGLFLLVGGVGAGIILVQQNQNISEKAVVIACATEGGTCVPTSWTCTGEEVDDYTDCRSGQKCGLGTCTAPVINPPILCANVGNCLLLNQRCCAGSEPSADSSCSMAGVQTGYKCKVPSTDGGGGSGGGGGGIVAGTCPQQMNTASAQLLINNYPKWSSPFIYTPGMYVGNNPTGDCYQGGEGNKYACYKLKANPGIVVNGTNCTGCGIYTWHNSEYGANWCFDTTKQKIGVPGTPETCSLTPQQCAGTTQTAQCTNLKAYNESWVLLTTANLSALKTGNKVNFCATGSASSGSFTKAKFTINGVVQAETTTIRPGSTDFCQEYTIPANTTTFNVTAQIYHATLGWK